MDFFLLGCESRGNPVPRVISWRDRMDYHAVLHRELGRLPRRSLLYIEPNAETLFADILTVPFFMVSDLVWEVMGMYGLNRLSRQVILLDGVNGSAESYRMPQREEHGCLQEASVRNRNNGALERIVLDRTQQEALPALFRLAGEERDYVIGRLDLVESILRRGARGIRLEELESSREEV